MELHPEKDSELDSNTSSPQVTAKPVAKNTTSFKTAQKNLLQAFQLKEKVINADLKATQEEHKLLKQEHDILEYEVLQTEKLQDSID